MDQNSRDRKEKPNLFTMGDSMVKKLNGYLLTKKLNKEVLLKATDHHYKHGVRHDQVKSTNRDINPQQIILHVGTNGLKTERTSS